MATPAQAAAAAAGNPALAAASGPATYAVRCVGWCGDEAQLRLHNLLKGLCVRHARHDENEYGLSAPLQSNSKQGVFRMIKTVVATNYPLVPLGPTPPVMWRLLHESPPLRGSTYAVLPACVMEVSESCLYGIYSVQAFCGMGCTVTYRVTRNSNTYVCLEDGLELTVSVFKVYKRSDMPNMPLEALYPGHAVEVRVLVPQGQQLEAAKKVGAFCQKLLPHVLLKKG